MHSDSALGLQDRLNNIAGYSTGHHPQPNNLVSEVVGALAILGFRHFATLTVNNINIIQRTVSSFAPSEKFFGRDLRQVISDDVIGELVRSPMPVIRSSGQLQLQTPFDQVYTKEQDQGYFATFNVYRDKFTRGIVVVFGPSEEALQAALWHLQAIVQLSVEATLKIPLHSQNKTSLKELEIEVLRWTKQHKTSNEVAACMGITLRQVNHQLVNAVKKLGAKNKGHAAEMAHEMGLFL